MYSARTFLLIGMACLLVLLPWVALEARSQKPPETVEKPKEKQADGAKDDKPKTGDKPKTEEKPKTEDKPKAEDRPRIESFMPTTERYVELLRNSNVLVRKRAAVVLIGKGAEAYSALLEMQVHEKDEELKAFLSLKLKTICSAKEKAEALVKTAKDSSADLSRRGTACVFLSKLLKDNEDEVGPLRPSIKEALEFAIADANEDLQFAAALTLEKVDPQEMVEGPERQIVHLTLDPGAMKELRVKADDVVQGIQKQHPEFNSKLLEKTPNTIEVFVSATERIELTERMKMPNGIKLKDVLSKDK